MVPEHLERKYINQLSFTLVRFHWKGNSASFRCPLCGDSKKSQTKTRGCIYPNKSSKIKAHFAFKCHNCGESMGFPIFLKRIAPSLYDEFKLESIRDTRDESALTPTKTVEKIVESNPTPLKPLAIPLTETYYDSPANTYYTKRGLPAKFRSEILYAENFQDYVLHDFLRDSDKFVEYEKMKLPQDRRLIFVYRDRKGKPFAVQGRSLVDNAKLRYITIRKDDATPKVFGLERHNPNQNLTLVTEGPIDSLFLPNSLAVGGAGLNDSLLDFIGVSKEKIVMIYDNEPRNRDIVSHIQKAIDFGVSVVIWKGIPTTAKDINKMLMEGMTRRELLDTLAKNIYRGLDAQLELNEWKRTTTKTR